jgi:hypothetical protein
LSGPEPDKLVTLANLAGEIEATLLANELKNQGIRAEASGVMTAGFRAEAPGSVKVLIRAADHAEAKRVMDEYFESRKAIDWDQVDVGEPENEPPE